MGDSLLDRDLDGHAHRLCPDAPAPVVEDIAARERAGGAGLAAAFAARDGHDVTLITALGDDPAGDLVCALLNEDDIAVIDVGRGGHTPEKVRIRAGGQVVARLDHGGAPPSVRPLGPEAQRALAAADAVLVSDYGRGITDSEAVRRRLEARDGALVWDPHPRGSPPVVGVDLFTPNAAEAAHLAGDGDPGAQARRLWR